ncbi:MAG: VOC family protein [Actinobacteria bacterium]|nr:VOC family protein [Actinomycetota bacterium]
MVLDVTIPSVGRHAFIPIGGPAMLHAWEVEGTKPSDFGSEIFNRGRVDHLALVVDSDDDFEEVRRRLVEEGATEGEVNDFGVALSFSFIDLDGTWTELAWWKDGVDPSNLDVEAFRDPIADKRESAGGD